MTRKVFEEQKIVSLLFNLDIRQRYLSRSIEEIDNSQISFEEKYIALKEASALVSDVIGKNIKHYQTEKYEIYFTQDKCKCILQRIWQYFLHRNPNSK